MRRRRREPDVPRTNRPRAEVALRRSAQAYSCRQRTLTVVSLTCWTRPAGDLRLSSTDGLRRPMNARARQRWIGLAVSTRSGRSAESSRAPVSASSGAERGVCRGGELHVPLTCGRARSTALRPAPSPTEPTPVPAEPRQRRGEPRNRVRLACEARRGPAGWPFSAYATSRGSRRARSCQAWRRGPPEVEIDDPAAVASLVRGTAPSRRP